MKQFGLSHNRLTMKTHSASCCLWAAMMQVIAPYCGKAKTGRCSIQAKIGARVASWMQDFLV